eukprot:TRINITY_DN23720_c0_g1_i1.p1 TRINITY_DN23720_c0_g1~~TRINITY_DN23720_c0_g1_i1.p1  ORF type:complete len:1557 (+),score=263.03 TRINITY_DN23720_c0_g1_i1:160-4830(+)
MAKARSGFAGRQGGGAKRHSVLDVGSLLPVSARAENQISSFANPGARAQPSRPSSALSSDTQRKKDTVVQALSKKMLFQNCSSHFLAGLANSAQRIDLKAEQSWADIGNKSSHLLVIESGAARVAVGSGVHILAGPCTVLNQAALLSSEYLQVMVSQDEAPEYEIFGAAYPACSVYEAGLPDEDMIFNGNLTGDQLCFRNLCPFAFVASRRPSLKHLAQSEYDRLPLTLQGAGKGEAPLTKCDRADFMSGGALVVSIDMQLIYQVGADYPSDITAFEANFADMQRRWQLVMQRCRSMFVAAPLEVLWAVAEVMELITVSAGTAVVREMDSPPESETVIILESGECVVEKHTGVNPHEARNTPIGKLRPGAIIGDWTLISLGLPRSASVVAETDVRILKLPRDKLRGIIRSFPGLAAGVEDRLNEVTNFIRTMISGSNSEPFLLCDMFAGCNEDFFRELSPAVKTATYFCGQVVRDPLEDDDGESSSDASEISDRNNSKDESESGQEDDATAPDSGTIHALQFGTCVVEAPGRGILGEFHQGQSITHSLVQQFGDLVVSSPTAVVISVRNRLLRELMDKYACGKRSGWRASISSKLAISGGPSVLRMVIQQMEVFKPCANRFVDELCQGVTCRSYMPGQTVVVMGAEDNQQMFMLRRGQVAVEIGGKKVAVMKAGATFGELVMLGVTQNRTATIRCMCFCTMLEIARTSFWDAIERFPAERGHFEQLALKNMQIKTTWPILEGVPSRFGLLLNLQASRRKFPEGDQSLNTEKARETAMLVLCGEVSLMNETGEEIDVLTEGSCYNEQILIGIPNYDNTYLIPKSSSEIQSVTLDVWEKILSGFPEERNRIRQNVISYMIERAQKRLGIEADCILRQTALFRIAHKDIIERVQKRLEPRVFKPGEAIAVAGQEGDAMYVLLAGVAFLGKSAGNQRAAAEFTAGMAVGEAVMVGAARTHSCTVRAKSLCLAQTCFRKDLDEALAQVHPDIRDAFEACLEDARHEANTNMQHKLRKVPALKNCSASFFALACKDADDVLFAPGDTLLERGAMCKAGESPVYVILSGVALVEGELGVSLGELHAGEITGEGAALTRASKRSATVRAGRHKFVHCARLHGFHMEKALQIAESGQENFFANLRSQRQSESRAAMVRWASWFENTVIPALRSSPLFKEWPTDLLKKLVAPFSAVHFSKNDIIVEAGAPADSMVAILTGTAQVETKNGMNIGILRGGTTFGDEVALDIFSVRTSTVRARDTCTVLMLPSTEIQRVLEDPSAQDTQLEVQRLRTSRVDQGSLGLPISALPLGVAAADACARAVAMQARRSICPAGSSWYPMSDKSPHGPHFAVLVTGRGYLLVEGSTDARPIMQLCAGFYVPEGLLSKHCAYVRAITACEFYSVRKSDFMAAVDSIAAGQSWYPSFRLHENQIRQRMVGRLQSANGATLALQPHPHSSDLFDWKERRMACIQLAAGFRKDMQELPPRPMGTGRKRPKSSGSHRARSAAGNGGSRPQTPIGPENCATVPALTMYPILHVLMNPPEKQLVRSKSMPKQMERRANKYCW